jgi:type VI secretion system secreted protein VgrG
MLSDSDTTPATDTAPPSSAIPTPFTFTADGCTGARLRVLSFSGREAVSRPFRFDVTIAADAVDDLTSKLFGKMGALAMSTLGGDARSVCGIVAAVEALGALELGRRAFRLRLVPRLWLLGKRKTSRVFQGKTVPEIVGAVLGQAGVPHRSALVAKYTPRLYCVQYQETDLAFVSRLLAEEGIFYSFEHAAEETVVLGDSPHVYAPIAGDPELTYRANEGSDGLIPREHDVWRFSLRRALRAGAVLHRDYDFLRPLLDLRGEAKPSSPPQASAASEDVTPFEANQLRVYDHHGEDERPDVDAGTAGVRLEQRRRRAVTARGASACRRLSPGLRFTLAEHDVDALDGSHVIRRVEHEGRAPEVTRGRERVYANTFECVPADVALRPKRPVRTLQQVTETARVVGPAGEEIYTDEHGRVKVQFPWDLGGKNDEHSSCWVRVAQTWAGAGWGFQFIPRVGMEVVVTFVGGDADRPLVTGCVPNAVNVPPFKLPTIKTKSGIRTRTTPGGHGHNELSFEDRKGAEEVHLRAQRDLREVVNRDCTFTIGRNRTARIGGTDTTTVTGNRAETVTGNLTATVAQNRETTVLGTSTEVVTGRSAEVFLQSYLLKVAGNYTAVVGDEKGPSSAALFAHGSFNLGTHDMLTLVAQKGLVLECGDSRITISPDSIKITAKELVLSGSEAASFMGKGPALHLTDDAELVSKKVRIYSEKASVELDGNASVRGKLVLLNCQDGGPDADREESTTEETKPLTFKVTDENFKPYTSKKYHVVVDGRKREGTTGGDGMIHETVPKVATSAEIMVWIEEFPTGQRRHWTLDLTDALPAASSIPGARARLRNLGYPVGAESDDLDEVTRKGLRELQSDHGLPVTGALDEATTAKLGELHGH